ncbi:ATP synthase F0 subunit B [Candidatus Gracilibacteria bacterium]|nr:ATP synthase F0 subunit B [Candidatus Gracilibacteria bacterium]
MAQTAAPEGLTNLYFVTVETFVIQFIILIVVLYVLNRFIFQPYLIYLDEWEVKQKKVEDDYKNIDALVAAKNKEAEKLLADARVKGNTLIEEAEARAKKKEAKILMQAEEASAALLESSKKQAEQEKKSMLTEVKASILDLTLRLNEKLFKNEKVSKDFIEKNIDSL